MVTMMEMNDFVIKHADAKYFDADMKLYKKHFPISRLIPELDRAPDFQKKALDERILFELLNDQNSCIDCIWENRGFIFDGSKLVPIKFEEKQSGGLSERDITINTLLKADFQVLKHNDLKKFVFGLELDKNCQNHQKATYLKVLNEFIDSLKPSEPVESHSEQIIDLMNQERPEDNPEADIKELVAALAEAPVPEPVEGKKKEDQEQSTPE